MSFYRNTHTQEIRHFNVAGGKVIATIDINGQWVSNPSIVDFENAGWEEYQPQPELPSYSELVVQYIRECYTIDQEFSIHRQRDEKPSEWQDYCDYVEACKLRARNEVESRNQNSED